MSDYHDHFEFATEFKVGGKWYSLLGSDTIREGLEAIKLHRDRLLLDNSEPLVIDHRIRSTWDGKVVWGKGVVENSNWSKEGF